MEGLASFFGDTLPTPDINHLGCSILQGSVLVEIGFEGEDFS
jgi:hypothetical protein